MNIVRIKDGYMLREVAGNSIVVAVGKATLNFNGLISLNDTGTFLWKLLSEDATEQALLVAMLNEYEIDSATASKDITEFIEQLKGANLLV